MRCCERSRSCRSMTCSQFRKMCTPRMIISLLDKWSQAVKTHGAGDSDLRPAVEVLERWNGQMEKDQPAPFITQTLHGLLGRSLVASITNAGKGEAASKIPDIAPHSQVIEGVLRRRPAGWVRKDDWDGWLIEQLREALKIGRDEQGSPVSKWRWGNKLQWNFVHPVANGIAPLNTSSMSDLSR